MCITLQYGPNVENRQLLDAESHHAAQTSWDNYRKPDSDVNKTENQIKPCHNGFFTSDYTYFEVISTVIV